MKVSTKGLYGAMAVLDLAIHYGSGHVHKADIAERQGIPEQYLAQILSVLRRAGIVNSVRGPSGGHVLARAPNEVSVGEIVEMLDGPQVQADEPGGNELSGRTVIRGLLREADDAAANMLYSMSFDKLVARWRETQSTIDFVI